MTLFETIFLVVYFVILAGLSFYGAHRYQMAMLYYRHKKHPPQAPVSSGPLPKVTIQLPVFNERYVVTRLIDNVCRIDYPPELLEIQVLDDSTDDTVEIARKAVDAHKANGVNIVHLHRTDRTGFKAGALQAGMLVASGEFIAVFDADFVPSTEFLSTIVPYFNDDGVGMVQARWDHINREYSLLTQAQSIFLDGHFMIEHTARNRSGRFFNFNGTAGVWRRTCIEDAGGWQHDTLTEDLDLSYRAQLQGWRFVFLNDLLAPAEIPVEMNAFKTQQHRWAKGSIQVAMKLLPRIFRSDLPFKVKLEAFTHLTNNVAYLMMVALSIMMPLTLEIRVGRHGWTEALYLDLPAFLGATVSVCTFYLVSQRECGGTWKQRTIYLPFVMALGIGLACNNALATLEAVARHHSPFVRTPKLAIEAKGQRWNRLSYKASRHTILPWFELALGLYYCWAIYYCIQYQVWMALPFMMLFQGGFLYIGLMSLFQGHLSVRRRAAAEQRAA